MPNAVKLQEGRYLISTSPNLPAMIPRHWPSPDHGVHGLLLRLSSVLFRILNPQLSIDSFHRVVVRKNSIRDKTAAESHLSLQIIVGQVSTMAIRVEPVVEMDLVQIRGDDLLSQSMRLRAHKWHVPASQCGDQRLHDAIGVHIRERVR